MRLVMSDNMFNATVALITTVGVMVIYFIIKGLR